MYLANTTAYANLLRGNQIRQAACGAGTRIMSPDDISDAYPFYNLDDIILGSHNLIDEGYFDGNTLFEWWRRNAIKNSVEYISNEAVSISASNNRVDSILLKTGERVFCGTVVNATGTHAAQTARMAGLHIPVEPRLRYSFLFSAEKPLDRTLPLTIDPSGVHVRSSGAEYLCGCAPEIDSAAEFDNFQVDHKIWDDSIWPALAARIPTFEAIKVINSWAGHYAFNTFDQNAIVGPHSEVDNFMFLNGFSGHGLQQSPAMGRAINEFITYGEYRTLDLSILGYERLARNDPFIERAII
jgi:glycine/D-amino acid oxidase-like deaminating enzyme